MGADVQSFKNVMARWATGIAIITTTHAGEQQGFTANSLTSVSIEPLLISMSVAKTLHAGDLIQQSGMFAVNILKRHQAEWGQIFAGFTDATDRFAGIATTPAPDNGSPLLPDTLGWLACKVHQTLDVGTSTLILGQVTACSHDENGEPLAYFNRQWGHFQPQQA